MAGTYILRVDQDSSHPPRTPIEQTHRFLFAPGLVPCRSLSALIILEPINHLTSVPPSTTSRNRPECPDPRERFWTRPCRGDSPLRNVQTLLTNYTRNRNVRTNSEEPGIGEFHSFSTLSRFNDDDDPLTEVVLPRLLPSLDVPYRTYTVYLCNILDPSSVLSSARDTDTNVTTAGDDGILCSWWFTDSA